MKKLLTGLVLGSALLSTQVHAVDAAFGLFTKHLTDRKNGEEWVEDQSNKLFGVRTSINEIIEGVNKFDAELDLVENDHIIELASFTNSYGNTGWSIGSVYKIDDRYSVKYGAIFGYEDYSAMPYIAPTVSYKNFDLSLLNLSVIQLTVNFKLGTITPTQQAQEDTRPYIKDGE